MKLTTLLLFLFGAMMGCNSTKRYNYSIGNTYVICNKALVSDKDNPFDDGFSIKAGSHYVIIEDVKDGYVKYCEFVEKNKPNHMSFSHTFEDFDYDIKQCN